MKTNRPTINASVDEAMVQDAGQGLADSAASSSDRRIVSVSSVLFTKRNEQRTGASVTASSRAPKIAKA